jgi:hypothetical protein
MRSIAVLLIFLISTWRGMTQTAVEDINIQTSAQMDSLQHLIRQYIWPGGEDVFSTLAKSERNLAPENEFPEEYEEDYTRTKYSAEFGHLKRVDKITLELKPGFNNVTYLLHPKIRNGFNIPIIYHGGHDGIFWEDVYLNNSGRPYSISVIDFLLGKGFDVIAIEMPLCGANESPVSITEDSNTYLLRNHDDIFKLKKPFYYFLEPVRKAMNFMERKYGCQQFVMIGLSGGGWTTTVYSAIDNRVVQSYEIAGSVPIPLRTNPSDVGDKEQNFDDFYNRFNYSTLYTLAAHGANRLHYQILNVDDNCCFDMDGNQYWVPFVQQKLAALGDPGSFYFYHDPFATMHKISAVAVDTIYSHIKNGLLSQNIPYSMKLSSNTHTDTICGAGTIQLSVSYHTGDSLQWYRNDEPIENAGSGDILIDRPGSYYVKGLNVSDMVFSSDTLDVAWVPDVQQPSVTERDDILLSSEAEGNQWYLNGSPLPNETKSRLKPVAPGSYSVMVTKGHCSSSSTPYLYGLSIYPVPSTGEIYIRSGEPGVNGLEVLDINGRLILKDLLSREKKLDLSALGKGVYLIRVVNGKGTVTIKKIILY